VGSAPGCVAVVLILIAIVIESVIDLVDDDSIASTIATKTTVRGGLTMKWLLAIATAAVVGVGPARGQEQEPEVSFEENLLARTPNGVEPGLPLFSPDGRSVAYSATVEERESIVVGESQALEIDHVRFP
jgi:hypothetical protein